MTTETLPAVDTTIIDALAVELRDILGLDNVIDETAALSRASVDGSEMSPIVKQQYPLGRAQLIATPTTAEDIAATVGAAARHGVPITPRGKGTGNYGQAIPMSGGLVLDTTKARTIVEVGDGVITADAGASIIQMEQLANKAGQQLLMYPSTVQSTIGGFLSGGSGGTGSIAHGMLHTGFVTALDVTYPASNGELIHLEGEDAEAFLHNYGVAGIICRATVKLEPIQPWKAFYASFDDFHDAFGLIRPFAKLSPTPRLVSADIPVLADALPNDPEAMPAGKASLRAILDEAALAEATQLVEAAGGTVTAVREGLQNTAKLSMMSYNHPIEWLMKAMSASGKTYFHIEVSGDALVDRVDELHEVYPGAMLHIEAQQSNPIGMLAAPFTSSEDTWAGFAKLTELGVRFHNPHQWFVDYQPAANEALKATTDPDGLLNPGKLVEPNVITGSK